jgi:hypothetical protein
VSGPRFEPVTPKYEEGVLTTQPQCSDLWLNPFTLTVLQHNGTQYKFLQKQGLFTGF